MAYYRISFFSTLLLLTSAVLAQSPDYTKAMKSALHVHDTASTYQAEQAAASAFQKIGNDFTDEWLPNYWASYVYTQLHNATGLPDAPKGISKEQLMSTAQKQLDIARSKVKEMTPTINSDLKALQAFIYYFNARDTGREKGIPLYNQYVAELKSCLNDNPDNPLAFVLMGTEMLNKVDDIKSVAGGRALLKMADQKFKEAEQLRALTTAWNHEWLWLYWLKFSDKQILNAATK